MSATYEKKEADSNSRLRQVAIVLTSVDSTTARRILSQFSPKQAKLVREQLNQLGAVSDQERRRALMTFRNLSGSRNDVLPSRNSPTSSSVGLGSKKNANRNDFNMVSPAEELLSGADFGGDRIEIGSIPATSYRAPFANDATHMRADGEGEDGFDELGDFRPLGMARSQETRAADSRFVGSQSGWSGFSSQKLAMILKEERPIVIAAVVQQIPGELAAGMLEQLAPELAAKALETLPQLGLSHPSFLLEIQELLEKKLDQFESTQGALAPSTPAAGELKLREVLAALRSNHRSQIESYLAPSNRLDYSNPARTDSATQLDQVASGPVQGPRLHTPAEDKSSSLEENDVSKDKSELPPLAVPSSFEELDVLPLEDLAAVLKTAIPDQVLIAFCFAKESMKRKIEQMIAPKEVERLRLKWNQLRDASPFQIQNAQKSILDSARSLVIDRQIPWPAQRSAPRPTHPTA